jgi:hypothetical protein
MQDFYGRQSNNQRLIMYVVGAVVLLWFGLPYLKKCFGGSMENYNSGRGYVGRGYEGRGDLHPRLNIGAYAESDVDMEMPEEMAVPEGMTEGFDAVPASENAEGAVPVEMPAGNGPEVDSKTGTVVDGPGFEKGEVDGVYQETPGAIPSNYYFLDDGASGEMSIQHNLCSKSCCSEQWPTPFKQKYDPYVCANKDKFVSSNLTCQNSFQDAGCLCLSKKQGQFLYNRGGNGRGWF